MNIIIPMAGMGKRLRPHTLTVPKPLVPVGGRPIVQRLVEDIVGICGEEVDEIAFIIGDFGDEVEAQLLGIAEKLGGKGRICYQDEPLGTAHAILCAKESLTGPVIVAFADTLFKADFQLDTETDGIIWVKQVEDPSAFGVIKMNEKQIITDFVEKPETFVSDLAIIGIYYFKDGDNLRNELQYLLDNDITDKGEYQLTSALENMKQKGLQFKPGEVIEWLDCGNKDATVYTNQRVLELTKGKNDSNEPAKMDDSLVVEPCYIGKNVKLLNAIVGPHVSIGDNCNVESSVIANTIIQSDTTIKNKVIKHAMIGNHVSIDCEAEDLSLGDFTTLKQ